MGAGRGRGVRAGRGRGKLRGVEETVAGQYARETRVKLSGWEGKVRERRTDFTRRYIFSWTIFTVSQRLTDNFCYQASTKDGWSRQSVEHPRLGCVSRVIYTRTHCSRVNDHLQYKLWQEDSEVEEVNSLEHKRRIKREGDS